MRKLTLRNLGLSLGTSFAVLSLAVLPVSAAATTKAATANSNGLTAAQQAKLQLIINRGNSEISRRLSSLGNLNTKINSAVKLSAGDKATLSAEVSTEMTGLTALKAQLDAETTVAAAQTDAQSIINDYRVYALIVPKVYLVKTADDQQVAEGKLTTLATNLGTRLSGKTNDSALQAALTDMNSKISAAQTISSNIETSVIGLQPSDYNSNHSVLSGDRDQLKTAQNDIQAAVNDGKTIIAGLK